VDNYTLENSDILGWGLVLSDNFVGPLDPEASDNVTLTVTILEGTSNCTRDNITVTARSQENENVRDNASCIAHAVTEQPVLVSPENGTSTPDTTPTFTWYVRAGADNHRIEVDNDLDFSSPADNHTLGATDDTWTKPALGYASGTYYWRVWALNYAGENCSENTWQFTVTAPGKPVLVLPENGTLIPDTTPTFTWQVGAGATYHRIEVDNDFNFSSPVDNVVRGATDDTWTKTGNGYALGTYYWRVWAISSAGENCSENTWNFTVTAPGKPVLLSPENNYPTTDNKPPDTTPTFTWQVGAGVTYHRIEVDNDFNFSSPADNRILDDTDNNWTKPAPGYASGTYYWRVWAINPVGENCSENTWQFTVTAPGKPVLVSPENGTLTPDTTPTFAWQVRAGATYHRIEVDNDFNFSSPVDNVVRGAADNNWTKTGNGYALGTCYWRVWSISSAGENCSENTWKFTVIARAGVSISISPGSQESQRGSTLTYTVTVWNTGNVVDNYNLRVWDNPGPYENWGPALDNNQFLNVGPGENRTTTLRITVSLYSPPDTIDNMTIRATSAENGSVYAENSCIAHSELPGVQFYPTDDADVHKTTLDKNYGTDWLDVGRLDSGAVSSFLKFELMIPHSSTIEDASLSLYCFNNDEHFTQTVFCNRVDNDNWSEGTITWNNKPSIGGALSSASIYFGAFGRGCRYSWDVTSFVENEFGGDNTVSFSMVNGGENTIDSTVQFVSKEGQYLNADPRFFPYINVVYSPTVSRSVLVTISPSHVYDYPGKTISYSVTVQNVGWANSSYTLEVVDTLGWTKSLSNTSVGPLSPSASDNTTTLSVTIPSNVDSGTVDSIFVTARSVESNNVWDQRSCTAGFLRPTVSISPSYQENLRGENLVYTVMVTNNTTSIENFALSVWDNRPSENTGLYENWSQTLDNTLLENVPPGWSKTTTLTVTVSWNSPPGTSDNITVIATSQRDNTVKGNGSCIAHSKPLEMIVYPTDDAYVWGSTPDSNYGNADDLHVGRNTDNVRSFLKFDLSSIPGSIENARLSLIAEMLGIRGGGEIVQCHRVDDDTWSEGTITWNNKSLIDITLDNQPVTAQLIRYFWDVTSFVKGESGVDNKVSFCMVGEGENKPSNNYIIFFSKEFENGDYWPYLLVGYKPSSDANLASISISPEYQSRFRGNTLAYTVTVKNLGWHTRTYRLEDNDDLGWTRSISPSTLKNVLPGENRVATLTVTVPENAAPCTKNNITVWARDNENENIYHSASCVAHSAVVAMNVTISSLTTYALKGRMLEYTITLANLSTDLTLRDNYTLRFTDDAGWGSNISFYPENRIENVLTGGSKSVKLRVTIPENANPGTQDNITITARSEIDNVENSASCVAISGILAPQVSITPGRQDNVRETTTSYTVQITNNGTVRDNYTLTVLDNAGQYPSWEPTISSTSFINVLPGWSKTTTLTVTVSWYSPPGTSDNITVRATSAENANVYAENSCIAYSKPAGNVYPIDDAYVNNNAPNNNYGNVGDLYVGKPPSDNPKRTFLKFDLRLPGGSTIDNALLYLWATSWYVIAGPENVECWSVDNDDWNEHMITWNNKPENKEVLDSQIINSANRWYSWRVTDFVKNQFDNENDQIVSFCMISSGEPNNKWASFSSKESIKPPHLEVVYHGVNQHSVAVSISPDYISGMRRISYSVTVQNIGWENSSYELSVHDNLGWGLALDSDQFSNIRPGENMATTLRVRILYGTPPYTRDEITVKATDIENVKVIGFSKCIAKSVSPIMSISPSENNAPRGTTLTYTVRVTNPGTIPENFVLSVWDNAVPSWNPTLDNHSLYVQPGESQTTTLRVKASWNSPPETSDNMTVRVALVTDENVRVENSCMAYSTLDNMKIYPIDDSFVLENASAYGSNYGIDNPILNVGWSSTQWSRGKAKSFLRFYLGIPGASTIDSAQLYLRSTIQSGSPQVQCCLVNIPPIGHDNWYEATITWNNKPAREPEPLDTQQISGTSWFSWGVTNFVKNQFGGDNKVSLCMASASEGVESENWAKFYSKEGSSRPYLLVSYSVSSRSPLVTISPENRSFRDNVFYSVMVQNVGWENSSYTLEIENTLGWPISLDNYRFDNIRPGENRTATLRVIIPENIAAGTRDEIIVKATCVEDTEVIGSAICMAYAAEISRLVKVSISPLDKDYARPGMSIPFTVEVTNMGNIEDNYDLTVSDNSGWGLTLSPTALTSLTGGVSGTATLTVLIPNNSTAGTYDSILVRATSRTDSTIFGQASCLAHTISFYRRVGVSISPDNKSGLPGGDLTFTVTVTNTGNVRDNFLLTVGDNAVPSWSPTLSAALVGLDNGASKNLELRVRIPNNATSGMEDNIQVIAQSKYDNTKSDNDSCIAQVIRRSVGVGISPAQGNAGPGENATFTVMVTNTGGAADNYVLTKSDNASWSLGLSLSTLSLAAGASRTATLTVTISASAENNTQDNVTVTARSLIDNTVENSASCIANCVAPPEHGVQVSISPEESTGLPGDILDFTVTVTNTGNVDDTYDLIVSNDHGWELRLDAPTVAILTGESTTVTVSVTIPSTAADGDSTTITVTATSRGDPMKSDTATCTATSAPPSRGIVPIAVWGVAIGGGLAVIAVLLKKGIIHLPSLRSRFMRSRIRQKF